jgi:hypothetical protein
MINASALFKKSRSWGLRETTIALKGIGHAESANVERRFQIMKVFSKIPVGTRHVGA